MLINRAKLISLLTRLITKFDTPACSHQLRGRRKYCNLCPRTKIEDTLKKL